MTNSVDTVLSQERQILAEVKQKLAQQEQLTTTLQQENQSLRQQNQELKFQSDAWKEQNQVLTQQVAELRLKLQAAPAVPPGTPASADSSIVAALQASNLTLRTELLLTESRLADVSRDVGRGRSSKDQRLERELAAARSATKELERDRTRLKKQLERVSKELAKRGGPTVLPPPDNTERQLEIARARLEAYEAKAVPYGPEELALFRQRDLKLTQASPADSKPKLSPLPTGAGPLIAEAERAEQTGRLDEAEKRYLQVLTQDTNNLYTLVRLAAVQVDQNRLDEADKTLQKAVALDPQDWRVLFVLGHLRSVQGRSAEAADALSLSAKLNPEKPETFYFLGLALADKGQRQAAETALRRAIQLKPNWGQAHYQLAVVYATQQPPFKELAQWHYQKARDSGAPRNPELEKVIEGKKSAAANR